MDSGSDDDESQLNKLLFEAVNGDACKALNGEGDSGEDYSDNEGRNEEETSRRHEVIVIKRNILVCLSVLPALWLPLQS